MKAIVLIVIGSIVGYGIGMLWLFDPHHTGDSLPLLNSPTEKSNKCFKHDKTILAMLAHMLDVQAAAESPEVAEAFRVLIAKIDIMQVEEGLMTWHEWLKRHPEDSPGTIGYYLNYIKKDLDTLSHNEPTTRP